MLIGIMVTVIIFFAARFLASLCVTRAALYNAAAGAGVLLFLLGIWAGPGLFGRPSPAPVAALPAPVVPSPVVALTAVPASVPATHAPVSRAMAATGSPAIASIDAVTANALGGPVHGNVFPLGATIYVSGWAASSAKTRLKGLIFIIDHRIKYDGTADYGGQRTDVAKAYNAPTMTQTGFSGVALPTSNLPKGPHTLQVGGVGGDPKHYHLATGSVTFTLQ